MKRSLRPFLIIAVAIHCCSIGVFAQKSVSELAPAHAAALEKYLSANKDRLFRQEYVLDDDYLSQIRRDWGFGAKFKPNYAVADFNGDKVVDFAVLLQREGKEEWSPDIPLNERVLNEHNPDFPLTLVVFNGSRRGGYKVAFSRDLMGPHAAFINTAKEKGKVTLYYGIFETDSDTFLLAPAGVGYIIEFEKPL